MKEDKVLELSFGGFLIYEGRGISFRENVFLVRGRREFGGIGIWEGSVLGRRVNYYVECF